MKLETLAKDLEKNEALALESLSDDKLVATARSGNEAALEHLLNKHKDFVKVKARSYFLIGADKEDLVQEGMIGLYKAVRDFRVDKQASFRAFAELCITRQMITAIKTATRQKHLPLNSYISLNKPLYFEEEDRTLIDTLASGDRDPLDLVLAGEELKSIKARFGEVLSDLEAQVLKLYLEGRSYQEIAAKLKCQVKSVDNALQRVKRKVEIHLKDKFFA